MNDVVKDYYDNKLSRVDFARRYGLSRHEALKAYPKMFESNGTRDNEEKSKSNIESNIDNMISDHKSGLSVVEICKKYGISDSSVYRLFKKHNTKVKEKVTIFDDLETKEIIKKYNSGISLEKLEAEYNSTTPTISKLLKVNNITVRTRGRYTSVNLNDKQIEELIQKYNSGMSCRKLGYEYGCSSTTIHRCLRDNNIATRPKGFQKGDNLVGIGGNNKVDTNKKMNYTDVMIKDYVAGISVRDIAIKYGHDVKTVTRWFKEREVKIVGTRRLFDDSQIKCIIEKYNSGISSYKLGMEYGCKDTTITRLLRKNNVTLRTINDKKPKEVIMTNSSNTKVRKPKSPGGIVYDYTENKMSISELSKKYKLTEERTVQVLETCGVVVQSVENIPLKSYKDVGKQDVDNVEKVIPITPTSKVTPVDKSPNEDLRNELLEMIELTKLCDKHGYILSKKV